MTASGKGSESDERVFGMTPDAIRLREKTARGWEEMMARLAGKELGRYHADNGDAPPHSTE